jgi:hypothetical protein
MGGASCGGGAGAGSDFLRPRREPRIVTLRHAPGLASGGGGGAGGSGGGASPGGCGARGPDAGFLYEG